MLLYVMRDVTPSWCRNLTLSRKFFVSFGALLGLLSLTLAAGLFYLSKINGYVDRHQRITVPAVVTAATIQRTALAFTADRVARRDLSAAFEPWPSQDEVGVLSRSLDTMLGTLRERTGALERKTKELEGFSYSVAHDLKSPLREIEGFSSLLEQQYGSLLDPTARRYVTTIRTSALRLSALIDDLLRYARLEQQALPKTTVNLKALTDGVLADRAREVNAIGAHIRVEAPPATVPGDPTGLRQTLLNLLDNALKFARQATPPEITIGGSHTPTEYVLWVQDNGIGFDPRDAERIFGLFERLHSAQDYEGTGVGLAIVKLVMEKHRGRAWAESSPGKGSTFYVAFPTQHMNQGSSEH
ncbi:MAG: hypothetical protein E8D45_13640 [Nitrospira sp.]|nr:MAG: hypothetical protein E8D45_13640 [Nitrospira sp.]